MTTYCLGAFARALSLLPRDRAQWQALIDRQPEACPRGCNYACLEVCKGYANVQWKAQGRKA
jgi:hypothetical protein